MAPQPGPPRPYHFPHVARRTLDNGLRLLVAENHNAPLVSRARARSAPAPITTRRSSPASRRSPPSCSTKAPARATPSVSPRTSASSAPRSAAAPIGTRRTSPLDSLSRTFDRAFAIFADVESPSDASRGVARTRARRAADGAAPAARRAGAPSPASASRI